jgi:putative nucleotidyltransferase with HDIG domain
MLPGKVDQILAQVEKMRPMPMNVTRILTAIDEANNTASTISDLIGLDQALAASVLQMANSAGMGYGAECTSLNDAVMRLGLKRVKILVLGAASSGPLTRRLNGYRLGAGELWNHSVTTAMTAQWVSRYVRYPDPEEAYVAGLLHDMGKLILDQYMMVDYLRLLELMRQYKLAMWQVEEKLLGIDHPTIGSLMAKKWNFPVVLTDAIRFHHAPSLARTRHQLGAIINVANAFSKDQRLLDCDPYGNQVHPESLQILNLDEVMFERMRTQLADFRSNQIHRG